MRTVGSTKTATLVSFFLTASVALTGCGQTPTTDDPGALEAVTGAERQSSGDDSSKHDSSKDDSCDKAESGNGREDCEVPEFEGGNGKKPRSLAVYGDAPYGTKPSDDAQVVATPTFISAVNADPAVSTVIQVGDIHSGKTYCTEAYNRQVFTLWTAFADPLVYTPGDNEWSDCHKVAEGGGAYNPTTGAIDYVLDGAGKPVDYAGGDPLANLGLVRSMFFANPGRTLGGVRKRVLSQPACTGKKNPTDKAFVENVMWKDSRILFVTINLPGGSNNDQDIWYGAPTLSEAQAHEIAARSAADLRWLDVAFDRASKGNVAGVVIIAQADMWDPEKGVAHQAGYEPFVQNIASHTLALRKPVLMFNGDSHVYQSSNPLSATDALAYMHPGYDVPNFHRVVVHGSTLPLEYLRLTIDAGANAPNGTDAFGPFSWSRVIP